MVFSLNPSKTELTVTFEREPIQFELALNVAISTSSGWVAGTDYTLILEASADPKIWTLKFAYQNPSENEVITVSLYSISTLAGIPQAVFNYSNSQYIFTVNSTNGALEPSPSTSAEPENPKNSSDSPVLGFSPNLQTVIANTSKSLTEYG